ncbi:MAG TPA: hypothetical protein PKD86_06620 [Gemmatales bacterium]|nr:hypothetical protein [Gemmatales bacterium]HMP59010.1 hypothetical protein [Gemmatales bacterium]
MRPQHPAVGRMRLAGQGPQQPKPGRDGVGQSSAELQAELVEAREQAGEALRQQKVRPAQRDVVADFYKNLAPGGAAPPPSPPTPSPSPAPPPR